LIGPKAAFVLSVVKPWLEKVTAEPSWQLADAGRKMQLAKAIETGNQGLARSLMLSIGKYSPKDQADSQQRALQVGPYRVEPQ
jgi:cell division inhibitor SulA